MSDLTFCKSLIVKGLRAPPPCGCKSLMLRDLQEVSKIQTTRRKIVKKSFTQKVFLLTIFHSETKSFFIYFEKDFFHQSPLYFEVALKSPMKLIVAFFRASHSLRSSGVISTSVTSS